MLTSLVLGGLHQRSGVALPTGGRFRPRSWQRSARWYQAFFFLSLVPGARWYPTLKPTRRSLAPYTKTKTIFPHCTKIKNFFIVVLIPKPFLKFPDKLIGKGSPTTGVLSLSLIHISEPTRQEAISYAVFCLKKKIIVVLIPKPFLKFPDKLIGKGCPTTGVLSTRYVEQRIASLHLAETLRPTAVPHDSALHL